MEERIVNSIFFKLHLLINIENTPEGGGTLNIDTYTFDPDLAVGDEIKIEDLKLKSSIDGSLSNEVFSFLAQVISIQKTALHHQSFVVNIILESPDRETIAEIRKLMHQNNPEIFGAS
jgi:hypothetical protein